MTYFKKSLLVVAKKNDLVFHVELIVKAKFANEANQVNTRKNKGNTY